jgi:hypothetical protein
MDWWAQPPVNGEGVWWDCADDKVLSSLEMRRSRCCSIPWKIASNCKGRGPNVERKRFRVSEFVEKGKAGLARGKKIKSRFAAR